MTEISLEVGMTPDVELEVTQTSVEISVGLAPAVEIEVSSNPVELSVEAPPVYEITADRAGSIAVEITAPPVVNFSVGSPGEDGPPGGPGPPGPPGPLVVSSDAGNIATLGSDSFIYVPTLSVEGVVADHGLLNGLGDDDHPQYLTNARGDLRYDPVGAAAAGDVAHLAAADPHAQYLTSVEGNAAYDPAGAASSAVTAHEAKADPHPVYLTAAEADAAYVNTTTDTMSGTLTVQDLVIKGESPEPGLVWTAEDTLGGGAWQEPSSLVVAETSDPVLINWFDNATEGWVKYSGTGTLTYTEMNSPSMPGVIECDGDVWAEWQAAEPMVYEPGALYRMTVRARLDATALLSFGFQCYNASTPAIVVDKDNGTTTINPHRCALNLAAGDDHWEDDVVKPGKWLAWTGYLSGKAESVAEGIPSYPEWIAGTYDTGAKVRYSPLKQNYKSTVDGNTASPAAGEDAGWESIGPTSSAEEAVKVASGVHQWRPMFQVSGGKVWIDAIEIHRLDRSLELPGGIKVSDVYAESVSATSVTTENLTIPPSVPGHLLTATDEAGHSNWLPMPVTVSEGTPTEEPLNPQTINFGTVAGRQGCMVYSISATTTITSTVNTRVPGSRAVQFTLEQPAMVSVRLTAYIHTNTSSSAVHYTHVGVEDALGNPMYMDDWAAGAFSSTAGLAYSRAATSGLMSTTAFCLWKRYLQPGTYLVYPKCYLSAVDAAVRQIGNCVMDIEIDPGMTYLTGQRP